MFWGQGNGTEPGQAAGPLGAEAARQQMQGLSHRMAGCSDPDPAPAESRGRPAPSPRPRGPGAPGTFLHQGDEHGTGPYKERQGFVWDTGQG